MRAAKERIERALRAFEIDGAVGAIDVTLPFPLTRLAARSRRGSIVRRSDQRAGGGNGSILAL